MSFVDHVRACNRHDPSFFRPFRIGGATVGWTRHDVAAHLGALREFAVTEQGVVLRPQDRAGRDAALDAAARHLVGVGHVPRLRGELFPVVERWGHAPLAVVDRGAVAALGIRAFGVHVNGFCGSGDALSVWVGRRALDKPVAPGKLDNLVAGGQPVGITLRENVEKEAAEEAGLPVALARQAIPVGAISYRMAVEEGLRVDTLFAFDLHLPEAFVPRNTDGEIVAFERWPVDRVMAVVDGTDDFKFNVNLVMIDFLVRHGFLGPEHPDYLEIIAGMHR